MRLFIAIPTPEPVREAAAAVIDRLRGVAEVRWVTPERLHLTLKFLGEVSADRQEEIAAVVSETANKFSRFVVQCGGIGAFPTPRRPRIIWLGLSGEAAGRLTELAERLDRKLSQSGFAAEERPFQPHLTLGRVKDSRGLAELVKRIERETPEMPEWPVEEVHLVQSVLGPGGSTYTLLARAALRPEERPPSSPPIRIDSAPKALKAIKSVHQALRS